MDEIIKKAYSGNRASVNALYNDNKNAVYSIALCLLDDKSKAENVVLNIFSKIWKDFVNLGVETEEDFSFVCKSRAVLECKKTILREDPKAFTVPKNQNMMINSEKTSFSSEKSVLWKEAVSDFSKLHKFIFVARTLCKMPSAQIAKSVNVDEGTVKLAVTAQNVYFEKTVSFADVEKSIFLYSETVEFKPNDLSAVINAIDEYVTPFEKKALIEKIRVLSIVLAVSIVVAVIVLLVTVIGGGESGNTSDSASSSSSQEIETKWQNSVVATDYAVIDIKDYGKISIALDGKTAPITVENFINLANDGFYDGLTFHRIMEGFMMQGGDPDANGTGGSEKEIKGEFYSNGVENNIGHFRGAISMARSNDMDSASSQFFIVHKDSDFLNGKYAAFGFVVDGIEVVDKVCEDAEPTDNNGTIPFKNQPVINSVKIYSVEEFKEMTKAEESNDNSESILETSEIASSETSEIASEEASETSEEASKKEEETSSETNN